MLDVWFVVEGTYPTELGGVAVWSYELLRGLEDVSFRLIRIGDSVEDSRKWRFERPPNLREVCTVRPPRLPRDSIRRWARDCPLPSETRPALIHVVGAGLAAALGVELASRSNAPLLVSEHASYWREIQQGAHELECGLRIPGMDRSGAVRRQMVERFQRVATHAYRRAQRVTALYEGFRQLQVQYGAECERTCVVPNGVAVEHGVERPDPQHGRRPLRVGFVGRFDENKRPELFVAAALKVRETQKDLEVVLVGPGEIPSSLTPLPASVEFLGCLSRRQWTERLDLLVLTSRHEAQPLVLLEAMARGIPVVAPDTGACAELLLGRGGHDFRPAGLLVPRTERAAPFGQAISRLAGDAALWKACSQAGVQRVSRYYTREQMIQRYREIYQQVSGAHASGRAEPWRNNGQMARG